MFPIAKIWHLFSNHYLVAKNAIDMRFGMDTEKQIFVELEEEMEIEFM